ncbi:MAG: hypothetical protein ACRED5_02315, partial [Propylenella sp.]
MEEPRTTFSGLFSRRLELWPEELEKPTEAAFQKAAGLVKRTGTDKHFAVAAMLMPSGITMRELTATGCDTQRNVYGDLIAEGVVRPVDME